jgi:hypothetical protein
MKNSFDIARLAATILALACLSSAGCAPKIMAPRIPALKGGAGAPYGEEPPAIEETVPIKEAPEDVGVSELIK